MIDFNLVDEPWIPVRFADGRRAELGIRDALLQSQDIRVIEDQSPLVVAAVHRLLLAVLYRALEGPTDITHAKALLREGSSTDKIVRYLEAWHARFFLFDAKYPFYQVADYRPKEQNGTTQWKTWLVLAAEHNAGNAKVLWDHLGIAEAGCIAPSAAARWLLSCQTFALGGGNSDFRYTRSAPSASALMVLPLGNNLHDTLILSLVPQTVAIARDDLPIWERQPDLSRALEAGCERLPTGNSDLFTWRTRAVRLRANVSGLVDAVAFASGVACASDSVADPMVGYDVNPERGKKALQLLDRGLWRSFDSLLPDGGDLAAGVIDHASRLARLVPDHRPRAVWALGQAPDPRKPAKVRYWRAEQFALPSETFQEGILRNEMRHRLDEAEDAHASLRAACRSVARDLLSRGKREPDKKGSFNQRDKVVAQMTAIPLYWSALEARFHGLLQGYVDGLNGDELSRRWLDSVRDCLTDAWMHEAALAMAEGAWAIRAFVRADGIVRRKLVALRNARNDLEPEEAER